MKTAPSTSSVLARLAELGDGIRLRVLRLLETEELAVGELVQILQLPQSTVSRHLRVLLDGGWIAKRSEGASGLYRFVLDELDEQARRLWVEVRTQLRVDPGNRADLERLASVLGARRTDSRAFFGRVGGAWDDVRNELFGDRFTAAASLSLIPSDWVVADLGCGTGDAAELIAPWAGEVVAVDNTAAMLKAAGKRLKDAQNVRFVEAELESVPLEDQSVDAATLFLVLHHVADPTRVLAETRRILRSDRGGGLAVVVDMVSHRREEYRQTMGHNHLGFNEREMFEMFERAGFEAPRLRRLTPAPEAKGPGLFAASARIKLQR
ncbi:MAG: SAM-dependent methyltransferase [Phycisphaerales bacterium]|jgi:SAM-dependent methyltransferase